MEFWWQLEREDHFREEGFWDRFHYNMKQRADQMLRLSPSNDMSANWESCFLGQKCSVGSLSERPRQGSRVAG